MGHAASGTQLCGPLSLQAWLADYRGVCHLWWPVRSVGSRLELAAVFSTGEVAQQRQSVRKFLYHDTLLLLRGLPLAVFSESMTALVVMDLLYVSSRLSH
jgi:hypothetical protein